MFFWVLSQFPILGKVSTAFLTNYPPHALMLHYSSVKYDNITTIILKDAYNIEENSTFEHKLPSINNVCTILS